MQGDASKWLDYSLRDLTVNAVLKWQAQKRGEKVFLRTVEGQTFTYSQVHAITNRIANWFLSQGLGHGSHVAVMMENELECLFSHIALTKLGAVSIPVNTSARGGMLAHYLNFSDAVALIASAEFAERVVAIGDEVGGTLERLLVVGGNRLKDHGKYRVADFADSDHASEADVTIEVKFNDLAFIMFTSGTTGPSKGVMFTQARAFMWDEAIVPAYGVSEKDTYFVCTPLSHATGLFSGVWTMMSVGGSIGLTPRFSARQFWSQVRSTGATYTTLLGAMVSFIEGLEELPDDLDNPLRFISAAPYPVTWEAFEKRFGLQLSIAYGLTDHSVPTRLPMNAPREKRGSTGTITPGFELLIVDEDDIPVPKGMTGECLIRARYPWHSSSGYYKLPEQTLQAHRNGWFHTGDRGYLDQEGYFWFVDRAKDTIRRLGENISAYEVEQFTGAHPAIAEIAAYPLKADQSEEEVAVSVVIRAGMTLEPPELIRYCLETMPRFMVPRFIHVTDSLPRNLNQRVEKYKLRAWCEENRSHVWDKESDREFQRVRSA
jgi:crotonobetaine/carnitine-CoA ligase